jgi:hypothetical protein
VSRIRSDPFAPSPHSRQDQLTPPQEDFDQERARRLCAEITRRLLGDFAPALMLLPPAERSRVQCLLAYVRTLFDFARQPGLEGERLAAINRWEFSLESSLNGEPIGQPVFVRIAHEDRRRPWSRAAFDELGRLARRRASLASPEGSARNDQERRGLATALATALLETVPSPGLVELGVALMELRSLQEAATTAAATAADDNSRHRLWSALGAASDAIRELSHPYRHAAAYLLLAARRLHAELERGGPPPRGDDPTSRLGLATRIALLLRARWRGV